MNAKENIREQLSAYLDGELDAAQAKLVEQTLANDAELAEELEALRATRELLRSTPQTKAPEGFVDRVLAEVEHRGQGAASAKASGGAGRWLRVAGVAAMLVAAVGLGVVVSQQFMVPPASEPGQQIASLEETEPHETLETEGSRSSGRATSSEPLRGKGGAVSGDKPAPPPPTASPVVGNKRGREKDGYDRDANYDIASNFADARTEAFARLDEINGRSLEIYVDDLPTNQEVVEQVMVANGIALAPDEQTIIVPNQAVNLKDNRNFAHVQQAPPAPDVEEVQYLVYGQREQLVQLAGALESTVVRRQNVSQLPEPLYRQAIEAPGAMVVASEDKMDVRLPGRIPNETTMKKSADAPTPAEPNPVAAGDPVSARPKSQPAGDEELASDSGESRRAPVVTAESADGAGKMVRQDEAQFPTDQAADVSGPSSQSTCSSTIIEAVEIRQAKENAVQQGRRESLGVGDGTIQQERQQSQPSQNGYVLRGIAAGQDDADMMIVTLRRRVPPSRLNRQQQHNLDVLESQFRQAQQRPPTLQRTLQAAPAQPEPTTQPGNNPPAEGE